MIISLIAVLTINNVIGRDNFIPWYFSLDMGWFKYHTYNKPVIMGRKTFESIEKKPLLNVKLNIILSNHLPYNQLSNIIYVDTPVKALSLIKESDEVMIIGGSAIYKIFISWSTRMYLTYIDAIYVYGDAWFPNYNQKEWKHVFNISKHYRKNINHSYDLYFKILERYS